MGRILPPMPYSVVKRDDKWCVVKADGSKTFGCHPSRLKALRQLRAIEANEHKTKPRTR